MRLLFFFALIVFVAISLAFDKECNTKYCVEELSGCEDLMGTEKERDNCTDHGGLFMTYEDEGVEKMNEPDPEKPDKYPFYLIKCCPWKLWEIGNKQLSCVHDVFSSDRVCSKNPAINGFIAKIFQDSKNSCLQLGCIHPKDLGKKEYIIS